VKKVSLSVNKKLNIVLTQLNHPDTNPETPTEILEGINEKEWFSLKELVQILQKLKTDEYVIEDSGRFYISFEGRKFIEDCGYVGKSRKEKLNNLWKVIKIIGVIINGIILLGLAIMTYCKEDKINGLERSIVEKDSVIHSLEKQIQNDLSFLRRMNGKYPYEVKLLDIPALELRLRNLLGNRFTFFKDKWATQTPIQVIGNKFISTACEAHNCNNTNFIIVVDFEKNILYAGIREELKVKTYSEDGSTCAEIEDWAK
jgi:hypothetical protein